jgi:formylglycine-generating enzyme required for sulfatase activity
MTAPLEDYPDELRARFPPVRLLGQGGMGRVVLAEDPELGRRVAVKLLRETGSGDRGTEMRRRFMREAEVMARLTHPNLVRLFHHGVVGVTPYLVMEHLEGRPPDPRRDDPLAVMLPVAEALGAVHAAGLVHRDVKPENILLVSPDDRPVLIDFGLMKGGRRADLTRTGALVGTLDYLPPEALDPSALGPPTDFYAWGVTLYELYEGRPPFPREKILGWLGGGDAPPLTFSRLEPDGEVAALLRACLATDPATRPTSHEEVEALLAASPSRTAPTLPIEPDSLDGTGPYPKGEDTAALATPRLPVAALGVWGLLAACAAWWLWPRPAAPAPPPPPHATVDAEEAPELPDDLELLEPGPGGVRRFRNTRDGAVLVELPPRRFRIHLPGEETTGPLGPEVEVGRVLLAETEVTVAQYRQFLAESGWRDPVRWNDQLQEPDRPVVLHGYEDAVEYCTWAGGRLPTAPEWEHGSGAAQAQRYPWGDEPAHSGLANFDRGDLSDVAMGELRFLLPVGSRPGGASPYGLLDMAGNVAERTSTVDPENPESHLVAGGAWIANADRIEAGYKRGWPDFSLDPTVGFRLARDAPPR